MDSDERSPRPDEPSQDSPPPDQPSPEEARQADEAPAPGEPTPVDEPASEVPAAPEEPETPWPTTPPEFGEERPGGWPTEAPERGEVVLPPSTEDEPDARPADEFETAPWPTEPAWPAQDAPDVPGSAEVTADAAADTDATDSAATDSAATDSAAAEAPPPAPPPSEVEAYAPPPVPPPPAQPAHSVPATQPGESTRCPRCGTENRPGLAFCSNCGQRLVAAGAPMTVERPAAPEGTQACPRCGTHNRAGVPFCQNCGANLRAAVVPTAGYVPPPVEPLPAARAPAEVAPRGGALLGPIVLIIAAVGMATAWLLPFGSSDSSLWDRAYGAPGGYGIAFWNSYAEITDLAGQAYFGFAAPAPILVVLMVVLAVAGFLRARPGLLQVIGLLVVLVWSIGLGGLFVATEVLDGTGTDLIRLLANLSPAGIIFLLSGLIATIGVLTRFGRG